jgi:hypothetical protein
MNKKWCRKKGLRKWDEHLANVINDKREAYRKVYQRDQKKKLNTKDAGL